MSTLWSAVQVAAVGTPDKGPVTPKGKFYIQVTSMKYKDDAARDAAIANFKKQWNDKYGKDLAGLLKSGQGADYPIDAAKKTVALIIGPFESKDAASELKKKAGDKLPKDANIFEKKK